MFPLNSEVENNTKENYKNHNNSFKIYRWQVVIQGHFTPRFGLGGLGVYGLGGLGA